MSRETKHPAFGVPVPSSQEIGSAFPRPGTCGSRRRPTQGSQKSLLAIAHVAADEKSGIVAACLNLVHDVLRGIHPEIDAAIQPRLIRLGLWGETVLDVESEIGEDAITQERRVAFCTRAVE